MQQSPLITNSQTTDDFFIPDFCNMQSVLRLLVVTELLAIFLVLADLDQQHPFTWSDFALKSFLLSWVAISIAAIICGLRPYLRRIKRSYAAFVIFFMFLTLVAFFTFAAEGLLLFLQIRQPGDIDLKTVLARNVLMGGIIAGLVLRYFYLQEQLLRKQRAELTARVQALQARIRPHFLFNSMNIIASLIMVDPDKAEQVVEDLSALFRASLKAEGEVSLQDEINLCQRYLGIEKLRLGKRLDFEWRFDNLQPLLRIPALTLQPLLENAIYHGVEPSGEVGKVTILIRWTGQELSIVITNPYHADKKSHHKSNSMALNNIRERLQAHYGEQSKLRTQAVGELFTTQLSYPFSLENTES
ncbi:sensor histidine kinase [Agitococcus lubricus]|uniref:Two-component system sensor histidine kinase AlgZ n=1 Tax=Agitococcus lubricus TaxID=1077255 RepID=A0A2T5J3H2_9GAMM|nr:histidine kinase [Agitococcus lubricus]PTQ91078.1 two-component system sensor histidine kinase AlgZ [Agitococcus lubricus]